MTEYPPHLLPLNIWECPIPTEVLLGIYHHAMIGRRLDGPKEDCIDDTLGEDMAYIEPDKLPFDEMPNLSNSLIGGAHTLEDFKYIPIAKGKKNWDGKSEIRIEDYKYGEQYRVEEKEFIIVGWEVALIHEKDLPYTKSMNKKKEHDALKKAIDAIRKEKEAHDADFNENAIYEQVVKEEYENLPKDKDGIPYVNLVGKAKVIHVPTNLNYWHYAIDQFSMEKPDKELKNADAKWREMICENLADFLRSSFTLLTEVPQDAILTDWTQFVLKKPNNLN